MPNYFYSEITSNTSLGPSHEFCVVDASDDDVELSLGSSSFIGGRHYFIHRIDGSGNSVTVTPFGGDTVDGAASLSVANGARITLIADANRTNWVLFTS